MCKIGLSTEFVHVSFSILSSAPMLVYYVFLFSTFFFAWSKTYLRSFIYWLKLIESLLLPILSGHDCSEM